MIHPPFLHTEKHSAHIRFATKCPNFLLKVWCRSQNFIFEGVRFALVCLGFGKGDCQTLVLEWGYERKEIHNECKENRMAQVRARMGSHLA